MNTIAILIEVEDITTDEIEKKIKQFRNDKAADQKRNYC